MKHVETKDIIRVEQKPTFVLNEQHHEKVLSNMDQSGFIILEWKQYAQLFKAAIHDIL